MVTLKDLSENKCSKIRFDKFRFALCDLGGWLSVRRQCSANPFVPASFDTPLSWSPPIYYLGAAKKHSAAADFLRFGYPLLFALNNKSTLFWSEWGSDILQVCISSRPHLHLLIVFCVWHLRESSLTGCFSRLLLLIPKGISFFLSQGVFFIFCLSFKEFI